MEKKLIKVKAEDNHSVELIYSDGEKRSLDMTPYLDMGVFNKLKDKNTFSKVRIAFDTIEWECGVDLDPEFVNEKSNPVVSTSL